jgi:glycosyltransferase involved in cell wall biosynthesis
MDEQSQSSQGKRRRRVRVLHVIKTSDGAQWAIRQVAQLVQQGLEVHVAVPTREGTAIPQWKATGATLHIANCALPNLSGYSKAVSAVRDLVKHVNPDLIHTHSVTNTAMLRLALGKGHAVPRLFQVAGPLHLEHWHSRNFELALAGKNDYWIGSSKFINTLYRRAGVSTEKLFLSYHSADTQQFSPGRTGYLRERLGIPENAIIIGNINLIYPPKTYLGHKVGVKCHEDIIDAIALVQQANPQVWGVLIGGTFSGASDYENTLRHLALVKGHGQILMPGKFSAREVGMSWPDFDCAIHVPLSENCGGVTEPLLCEVPTIAGEVGGLPEVIFPGITGDLVPGRNATAISGSVLRVLHNSNAARSAAKRGRRLVSEMFDPARCGKEVSSIYRHVLTGDARPWEFDSSQVFRGNNKSVQLPTYESPSRSFAVSKRF